MTRARGIMLGAVLLACASIVAVAASTGRASPQAAAPSHDAAVSAASDAPAPVALQPEQVRRVREMGWPGTPPLDPTNRWADSDAAAALGHALFFDRGLSANGAVSCATCHRPDRAFSDGLHVAKGVGTGPRRTMTVLDSAHQRWLGWDGRADSLWSQALQPIERDIELGSTRRKALGRVA
ncbi:MAG: cytochrome-c peroxidase, partial [Gemmobacter sp.]